MKKFILGLGLLFVSSFASAQGVNGSYLRITPTSLPTLCRLGDVRVDSVSGGLNLCGAANNWALLASGSSVPALTTLGDTLYEDATPAAVRLPGNTTTTKKFLSQTGTGTISAAPAWAQPVCADLSNATASCSTDTTNASNISSGTLGAARLPNPSASTLGGVQSYAAVSNQWINSISTSGVPSSAQPAFSNISGTVAAAQLPNPSASTLGGVQSAAPVSNQWINSISTSGVPALSQPAFSNISGTASLTTQVTGTLPIANGGTNNGALGVVAGSMYYADGTKLVSMGAGTTGQVPISAGTTVAWGTSQGGLIGQRELIPNTNIEVNDTGYAAYADAAGVQPVDGTGGSPNTTCARSTSTPITGVGSLLITKAGSANRQGEGCAISTNTLSAADTQPNVEQVEFDYKVTSGTFTAGSDLPGSLVDSDYEVYLYDIANSNIIVPTPKKLYSNVQGHFSGTFQTATNATTYRLIFHNATTTTNNFTMLLDNISTHPSSIGGGSGPVVAKMNTLSTSSFTANAAITFTTIETDTYGALSSLNKFTCPLPGSYLVTAFTDTASSGTGAFYVAKNGTFSDTAANKLMIASTTQGSGGAIIIPCNTGDFLQLAANASFTSANTKTNVGFYYLGGATSGSSIPNPVVASRAHVSSGSATTAGNAVNFDTIDYDYTNSISTGATTWKYTAPYSGVYVACVNYYFGVGAVNGGFYKNGSLQSGVQNSDSDPGAGCDTFKLVAGDTVMFSPVNATGTPSALTGVSVAQANYIDIFMVQGANSVSGIPLPTVLSQATTYSATVGDYVYASGASYTITLPTAVGVKGREITIEHAGTSFTQVYTLNTTSSQTIGGIASGSYALYTNGEVLNLISDGANWRIASHKATTAWTDGGAVGLTSTGGGVVKGTTSRDKVAYRRNGQNLEVHIEYKQTATGTVGTGDYLFALPASLVADTTLFSLATTVADMRSWWALPGSSVFYGNSTNVGTGSASLYDSTHVRIGGTTNSGASVLEIGQGFFGTADTNVFWNINYSVPITGWQPN